jgi:hypothetical protein
VDAESLSGPAGTRKRDGTGPQNRENPILILNTNDHELNMNNIFDNFWVLMAIHVKEK